MQPSLRTIALEDETLKETGSHAFVKLGAIMLS